MPQYIPWKASSILLLLSLLSPFGLAQIFAQSESPFRGTSAAQQKASLDEPQKISSSYVGPEVCKTCHDEISASFDKSPHWKTMLDKHGGPSKQGCEACHGPGQEHIDGGGDKTKIFTFKTASPRKVNERCLDCHASGKDHANFSRSAHSENNLSCLSCHSSHHSNRSQFLLVKEQPELCYTCHLSKKA